MKQSNQILWDLYKTHTTNMSQWLNGNLDLSLDQLEKFCNKLGKTLIIKLE